MKLVEGQVIDLIQSIETVNVSVPLPEGWSDFGDNGGRICPIKFEETPENPDMETLALYTAPAGSVFYWHNHDTIESCTCYGYVTAYIGERVEGDDSKIRVTKVVELEPSSVFDIPKGVIHMFVFKTFTKLIIGWYPRIGSGNWKAQFVIPSKEEQKNYAALDALTIGVNNLWK